MSGADFSRAIIRAVVPNPKCFGTGITRRTTFGRAALLTEEGSTPRPRLFRSLILGSLDQPVIDRLAITRYGAEVQVIPGNFHQHER